MKKLIKLTLILGFIGLFTNVKAQNAPTALPEFSFVQYANEQTFAKSDLLADQKSVFIYFSPDCNHCQNEISQLNNFIKKFKNTNLVFVSSDTYTKKQIDEFFYLFAPKVADKKYVHILHDVDDSFLFMFKPEVYPSAYVYDSSGILVNYFKGGKHFSEILLAIE